VDKPRRDDLIITAGATIPGLKMENALPEQDAVSEIAVVGSPDEERGGIVKAFIVLTEAEQPSDTLKAALHDHVKAILAPCKYPRAVGFVREPTRTETDKIRWTEPRDHERGGVLVYPSYATGLIEAEVASAMIGRTAEFRRSHVRETRCPL
jgi:2-aminobenzoate-CoA ligase